MSVLACAPVPSSPYASGQSQPKYRSKQYPPLCLVGNSVRSGSSRPSPLRLCLRRILAVLLVICALFVLKATGSFVIEQLSVTSASDVSGSQFSSEGSVLIVEPGQTYWSIARSLNVDDDIRDTADSLRDSNGGRPLKVGDRLIIDVGYRQ